jgi:hypothetical protein
VVRELDQRTVTSRWAGQRWTTVESFRTALSTAPGVGDSGCAGRHGSFGRWLLHKGAVSSGPVGTIGSWPRTSLCVTVSRSCCCRRVCASGCPRGTLRVCDRRRGGDGPVGVLRGLPRGWARPGGARSRTGRRSRPLGTSSRRTAGGAGDSRIPRGEAGVCARSIRALSPAVDAGCGDAEPGGDLPHRLPRGTQPRDPLSGQGGHLGSNLQHPCSYGVSRFGRPLPASIDRLPHRRRYLEGADRYQRASRQATVKPPGVARALVPASAVTNRAVAPGVGLPMACEISVLLPTPPSISSRSPHATGGRTAGMAALAMTASMTGPLESSSSPVTTSTATTWSGIGSSSSRTCSRCSFTSRLRPESGTR